jgi:hypothetical protein
VDLAERFVMLSCPSWISIDRTPVAQSAAAGGRSSEGFWRDAIADAAIGVEAASALK